MDRYTFVCPCLFGLESVLADEIRRIGGEDIRSDNGRVRFSGGIDKIAAANIHLSTAERVLVLLGEFQAVTFDQLFEGTKALPWGEIIPENGAFPVKGYSLKSQLHSVPDCQAIVKKAVAESLNKKYGGSWRQESGELYQIQFSLLKDEASLMIDTTGQGLHKRGYRQNASVAPIKETLAAGIVRLARVNGGSVVSDPLCGSGTILIESAMKALNIAPGFGRHFAAEQWGIVPVQTWKDCKEQAYTSVNRATRFQAFGSDIDEECVKLSLDNARKCGVASKIRVEKRDIADFSLPGEKVTVICNPPYGERMLDKKQSEAIYRQMGKVFDRREGANYYIITSDEEFESFFGRPADKKRKLYNGMIKCNLYMYFK